MVKQARTNGRGVVVPMTQAAPARFVPYDADIQRRAYELWASLAGRHGARTLRLLRRELGDDLELPDASTIRRWAIDQGWAAKADADLEQSDGRTLYEMQVGWLAGLRLAQDTLLDAMAGELDALPFGGAGRIKAAETTLRIVAQAGLLAILPQMTQDARSIDWSTLSTEDKQALAREILQERKQQGKEA